MSGYGTYPRYRLTDVLWMPEVPHHWRAGKTKQFAQLRSGHTPSRGKPEYWENCTIPWFSLADVWQLRDERNIYLGDTAEKISELGLANSAADLLPTGTVILSRTASVGFSGIMPRPMATTQDFVNWIPGPELLSKYLLYVFRSMGQVFESLKTGTTHKTIYVPDVLSFSTPVPPLDEQTQIARFLDYETARIDALIEKQQQLIALLKEKRQAVIGHAVTKGLNPNVPLRDSGVEWLGMVPEHWTLLRSKALFRDTGARTEDGDEELLTVSHLTGVTRRSEKDVNMIEAESYEGYKMCFPRDLAVNTMWAWMGAMGVCLERGMVSPSYNVYRPTFDGESFYYDFVVRTPAFVAEVVRWSKGIWSSRLRLYPSEFGQIILPLPPDEEMSAIVAFLKENLAKYAQLNERAEAQVVLLGERRTALISAAVTGKIDVRNWTPPASNAEQDVA